MAKSLIVRLRFPFFRFYARMGDAQVDADVKHEDANIRRSALDQLVQLGRLYLGYLTKPRTSYTASKPDFHGTGPSYAAEEDETEFNVAGGGEGGPAS
jgi:hypothetical protein